MKNNVLSSTTIALSALISVNSSAYDAYNLHSDKWAIECSDGELASFSGDETGLKNAGSSLCESHGGLAGTKGEMTIKKFADSAKTESPLSEGRAGEGTIDNTSSNSSENTKKDKTASKEDAKDTATSNTEIPAKDTSK